jgi:hypothetical protein
VLDSKRILVTSSSNFGAPRAREDQPEGTALSLDPSGPDPLVVPRDFAMAGGQTSILSGRVQVFTAQSPMFLNRLTKPGAVTADQPAMSNPRAISINNAFGRVWFANMPAGLSGTGTETIIDPDGRPLANAPDEVAGGVFAGSLTNRTDQVVVGSLGAGAIGNALLGRSPDGSTRAVFAVVTADGALVQTHAEKGIDGLAPAGTVHPLGASGPGRAGVAFNWTPERSLFVAEPLTNSVAVLSISDDGNVFRTSGSVRHLTAPEFATPVDLAAAVPEVANPEFSSNTTLAGGSDMYVANRASGTLVRMRQDGRVTAVRRLQLPDGSTLGGDRIEGLAVSSDATLVWVTISGSLPAFPDAPGAVLEVTAFGGAGTP